ncbi:hypothetical protein M9H77_15928 [Catharanthus roseus]|uniref:Uncharacterized protein n=1 Tax=Catharanthus roseus TaxID=4058 RepID=A0ACC0B079_CATRO|nr:hypothetical protein M9H77_15928 [Catharanthus roseus]
MGYLKWFSFNLLPKYPPSFGLGPIAIGSVPSLQFSTLFSAAEPERQHIEMYIFNYSWTWLDEVVVGLLYDTNETILKDAFKPHGEIIEENAASNALKEMDGKLLDGRDIHVLYAHGRRQQ